MYKSIETLKTLKTMQYYCACQVMSSLCRYYIFDVLLASYLQCWVVGFL